MPGKNRNPVVAVTYDTIRFCGECTRLVENSFYFILPFLRPAPSTKKITPEKPDEPEAAPSYYSRPDREITTTLTSVKKEQNPILASFQNEIKKPPSPISRETPAEKKEFGEKGSFFSDVPFPEKDELYRAEIYVRDFDSNMAPMRFEALDQIKKLSKPTAVAILKKLLSQEKNQTKQTEALNALSMLNEKGDLDKEFFKGYLAHPNGHIRLAALRAISKYKDEESFEILSAAIKDPEADVRRQALNLICWTYSDRGIPFMMRLLHDVDDNIRKTAIQMCGTFKAQQAVSALITLLADEDQEVQKATNASLKKITKQDFDFHPKGSLKHKEEAIEAWRFWWINNQATFGSPTKGFTQNNEKNLEVEQGGGVCLKNLY